MNAPIQITVFIAITALIALATWLHCRKRAKGPVANEKDHFLASGGLAWYIVAGSITLTNLSTDQLIGMNGNQMVLLACWEFAAVAGLLILAFVFLPVYYRENCTTTTELLQKRYDDKHIRALIPVLFLAGNLFIFLPAILYGGSLFLLSMSGIDTSLANLLYCSVVLASVCAAYAIFAGLRAVAVSDTYSGALILGLALLLVYLAMAAIDFDLSGVPAERLTLIGDDASPIPWYMLLTTFDSILNASAALYVCDIHETYVAKVRRVAKLSAVVSITLSVMAIVLVPFFASQESLINTVQELYGQPAHYIHGMAATLFVSIAVALLANRVLFGRTVQFGRAV